MRIFVFLLWIVVWGVATDSVAWAEDILSDFQKATRKVANEALPTVVTVDVSTTVQVNEDRWFFFRPFGFNPFGEDDDEKDKKKKEKRKFEQQGRGSGFIVKKNGNTYYVLTNAHVVEGVDNIMLTFYNGTKISAKLVGKDDGRDLALLSFKSSSQHKVAKLGNSDELRPGDVVFAVGSPHHFRSSISFGIVSALGRDTGERAGFRGTLTSYIQTDVAINRGNSGGPLLNIHGEVIGINTWIYSNTGYFAGLSFSIPLNDALPAIDAFLETGEVSYGWLGVTLFHVRKAVHPSLTNDDKGALIQSIFENSPASKSGVHAGDIIREVNDKEMKGTSDVIKSIASSKPGSRVKLTVLRDGELKSFNVILGKRDTEEEGKRQEVGWPGLQVVDITEDLRESLSIPIKRGVLVARVMPNGAARISGLRPNDIIEKINNDSVNNIRDFYRELRKYGKGKEILFRVNRGGTTLIIGLVR